MAPPEGSNPQPTYSKLLCNTVHSVHTVHCVHTEHKNRLILSTLSIASTPYHRRCTRVTPDLHLQERRLKFSDMIFGNHSRLSTAQLAISIIRDVQSGSKRIVIPGQIIRGIQ